jgi:hypothetical protein
MNSIPQPPIIPIPPLPNPLPSNPADLGLLFDGYVAIHAQAAATVVAWEQAVATLDLYLQVIGQRLQEVLQP